MPVLVALCVLVAAAWAYLLAGHGGFWRTGCRLPPGAARDVAAGEPGGWPSVTAVVPARDEAAILPETLPTLLAQDYPGEFSVVLVDDSSTDGTGAVATALGAGRRLRVIAGSPPPDGWAGKVWAMAQGA
jgi:cellulose synthase/poly-beta-1,6-N-acetylglucosamine synthase-like glycosyltransferase